jgi:hypothetical protein
MTSTSSDDRSNTATAISIGRGTNTRRYAGMMVAACCSASLLLLAATAQAQPSGRTASPSASAFCAKIPAARVSSTLGTTVSLSQAVLEKTTLECIYLGEAPASATHPIDEVVISMEPGVPVSELSTRVKAEARVAAESPKDVKVIFTSLPTVGSTAFSWTYAEALNGGQLVGVADNKGSTAYGVALGGAAKTFGTAAGHVAVGERLLALDIAA